MKYALSIEDEKALKLVNDGIFMIIEAYGMATNNTINEMIGQIISIHDSQIAPMRSDYKKKIPADFELHFYNQGNENYDIRSYFGTLEESIEYCKSFIKHDTSCQTTYIDIYEQEPFRKLLRVTYEGDGSEFFEVGEIVMYSYFDAELGETVDKLLPIIEISNDELVLGGDEVFSVSYQSVRKVDVTYWLDFYNNKEEKVNSEPYAGTLSEAEDYCHSFIKNDGSCQTLYIVIREFKSGKVVSRCW